MWRAHSVDDCFLCGADGDGSGYEFHCDVLSVGGRVRPGLVAVSGLVLWPCLAWWSCVGCGFYPTSAVALASSRIGHSMMLIGFPFVLCGHVWPVVLW